MTRNLFKRWWLWLAFVIVVIVVVRFYFTVIGVVNYYKTPSSSQNASSDAFPQHSNLPLAPSGISVSPKAAIQDLIKSRMTLHGVPNQWDGSGVLDSASVSVSSGRFIVVDFGSNYGVFYTWNVNGWKAENVGLFPKTFADGSISMKLMTVQGQQSQTGVVQVQDLLAKPNKLVGHANKDYAFQEMGDLQIWVCTFPSNVAVTDIIGYDSNGKQLWDFNAPQG